jgi:hypothetical protein
VVIGFCRAFKGYHVSLGDMYNEVLSQTDLRIRNVLR